MYGGSALLPHPLLSSSSNARVNISSNREMKYTGAGLFMHLNAITASDLKLLRNWQPVELP